MTNEKDNKTLRVLRALQRRVGGVLRTSQRGVPHLVISRPAKASLSACYFGKSRSVRVFINYGQFIQPQEKFNFPTWNEAADFIEARFDITPKARPDNEESFPESREDFMGGWTHP